VHPRKPDGGADYTRTIVCRCIEEKREKEKTVNLLKYCELPPRAKLMTFDTFRCDSSLEEARRACLEMAEEKSQDLWITLASGPGRGKTHLAIAVCHRWLSRGRAARYAYVPLLMKELKDGFGQTGDNSYRNAMTRF
jgi:DNA replication protein DnaC